MSQETGKSYYTLREAPGEDSYSKPSVPRDVLIHNCRSRMVLSVEGEAAQERRVAAGIAKSINWLSVDCQHAMGHWIRKGYIGRAA